MAVVIEDVICRFLERTAIGDVHWHHNVHNVSNVIGTLEIASHYVTSSGRQQWVLEEIQPSEASVLESKSNTIVSVFVCSLSRYA